jgi:hypothetical protein
MKRILITAAIIFASLSLPFNASSKGPPGKTVILKDANGVTVGRVIGMEAASWPYVLTDEGYRTYFKIGNGMVQVVAEDGIYYDTSCDVGGGNAYLNRKKLLGTVFSPISDINSVYATSGLSLMYSPIDAQLVTVDIYSWRVVDGTCVNITEIGAQGFPAYPNDPNITGIANTAYPNRMLIE